MLPKLSDNNKTVLNGCRKRHTNLGVAWINYKEAYDMVPHSWILDSIELARMADNGVESMSSSMKGWNVELMSCGGFLGKVYIRSREFQRGHPFSIVTCYFYETKQSPNGAYSEVSGKVKPFVSHGRS